MIKTEINYVWKQSEKGETKGKGKKFDRFWGAQLKMNHGLTLLCYRANG